MSEFRKQSDTGYPLFFFMVDSTDHITGKTGLSPTVTLSKNGAAYGSPAGAVSEVGNGLYKIAGNATDSNTLGELWIHATASGADPTDTKYAIVPYDPFDGVRLGLTGLANAVPGAPNGLLIAGTNAATTFTSSAGSALTISSTGANGSGLVVSGNGTGHGISATGGATGNGIRGTGGATSGAGIYATASGASNYAIEAVGTGATDSGGIKASATTAGEGFEGVGAGNGHGMLLVGAGTGEGLHAAGGAGATAHGAHFEGIGTNSHGLLLSRGGTGGDDLNLANSDAPTLTGVVTTRTDLIPDRPASIDSTGAQLAAL
jgi:hypothetical protein